MSAFEYQLTRSLRRRSISIVVRRGQVKVMAPVFVPKFQVERFVHSKTPWVLAKLKQQKDWADAEQKGQKQFVSGEKYLYLGDEYHLDITTWSKSLAFIEGSQIKVTLSKRIKPENQQAQVRKLLKDWYKQSLLELVEERVAHFSAQMQVTPAQVVVRSYTRRWGSCSAKGVVSFNLLLMMAPKWVIDYVVVHELAHLVHLNHSPQFWALVEKHYPYHKDAKDYLKKYAPVMTL